MKEFSDRLKELRKERCKTLKEVSNDLGISISAYSNYEQGLRKPCLDILQQISKYFDVTTDYLLCISEFY